MSGPELEIPEESVSALLRVRASWSTSESFDTSLRSVVVPALVAFLRGKAAEVEVELVPAAAELGRATAGGTGWTAAQNQVVALAFLRDRLETWIAELGGGESR